MVQKALYRYSSVQDNQIRLLKFVRDGHRISAVLETFMFTDEQPPPPYHSISYTWGSKRADPAAGLALEIDKCLLPILDSLQPLLDTFRSKGVLLDGKWWWIDSICINQDDLEERAKQVQLMDHIYRQAEHIIAWLGESSSDSDLAIDFIKLLDKISRRGLSPAEIRATLEVDQYRPQWTALTRFLERKWWSRIWTVQEFVLPRSVSLWCGMGSVGRVAFCRGLSMADRCTSVGIKDTMGFEHAFSRRRAWDLYKAGKRPGTNLSLSLPALAGYFRCMDATDDRDRLYGLMALSTDSSLLQIDYHLSTPEVYLRFTQAFITQHKSLDIICLASIHSAPLGSSQPSWVPDWRYGTSLVTPTMASQSSKTLIGNLRGPKYLEVNPSVQYSASRDTPAVYSFEGSVLRARGVIVDTVDGLAGSRGLAMVQSSEWNSTASSTWSTTDILTSVCRSLVLDRKDRYLRYEMPTADFFRDFMLLLERITSETDLSAPEELKEWYQWTSSLRIRGRSFESILHDSLQAGYDSSGAAPNDDEYYNDTFFGRFFDTVVRSSLRLTVSHSGRIGMVTNKARKGDFICVLFGCSIPVVLRETVSGVSFSLIGECFLDGCMNGSALEQPELRERSFVIR